MATLKEIDFSIRRIVQESLYDPKDVLLRINNVISRVAAGIRLPDGRITPPMPALYTSGTVATTAVAMASLPSNYQRGVSAVIDSDGGCVPPASGGGDFYSYKLFMEKARKKDLTEAGTVYMAAVKGDFLYYQGIPSTSVDLTINYYRDPSTLALPSDVPEGIPEPYHLPVIKNLVVAEIYGDFFGRKIEADLKEKRDWHMARAFDALINMTNFIGEDGSPEYFG